MTITRLPLSLDDAIIIPGIRQSMLAQKGKFIGTAARAPFDIQMNAVPRAACNFVQASIGGVSGWWCHPSNPRPNAAIIYYHGGWYMLGTAESYRNQASQYAALTKASTFVPDYRRSPEARFPAAYDDAVAAYRGMVDKGKRKIALVGDSVGGALSLLVLAAAMSDPLIAVRPVGAVAVSPTTDLTLSGGSLETRAVADPIFTRDMVSSFVSAYLNGADPKDPRASPLFGRLKGLPPIMIDVGDDEILLDDAVRYAERAAAEDVDIRLGIWEGLPHAFPGLIGRLPAAQRAFDGEAVFLKELLR